MICMKISIPELSWSPYGLLVILSVILGFIVAVLLMRRFKVGKQTILYTCLLTFICTLVTSLTFSLEFTERGPVFGFSGLAGVIGMIGGVFLSGLILKDKPDSVMASFVAAAPLMYGLAKTGCLFAGCCHGKDYTGPLAIIYHGANEGSYFPAQLVDMTAFILIHILSLILVLKMKDKIKAIFTILAVTIPVRFLLEYLKYYHDGSIIASGQIKVLIAGGLAVILIVIWKKCLSAII